MTIHARLEQQWQQNIKRGDVVAFRFPHLFPGSEEPKIRPSLVLDVVERGGERFALLAYGSASGAKLRPGYLIPVRDPKELEQASLHEPTVFDGRRRLLVSLKNGKFDVCKSKGTPVLGRLTGDAEERMNAVRARIHAERDMRRPGFQRMKAAANRQQFDVVVVEAIDRLTRQVKDALSTFDLFTFQNIELHSIQEGPQDFMKVLFAGFGAQMFSQKIADHTRRGMQGAVTRQRLHTRAYGYRKRNTEHRLNREIDPEQAHVLRRIFTEFASGKSTHAIAHGLNADHVPAPNGGTWEASTLRGNPTRQEGSCATGSTSASRASARTPIRSTLRLGRRRSSPPRRKPSSRRSRICGLSTRTFGTRCRQNSNAARRA